MLSKTMKKKNVIILTIFVVASFIVYQLYFFLSIASQDNNSKIIPVFDHSIAELVQLRSEEDKFINEHGILRGVYFVQMPRYRPDNNNEFKCLNANQKIPFERVNDDYCDCEDGSDEPSTDACPNGTFNCDTQSYKKSGKINSVPSGKINDGICDCCDGSDEWLHPSNRKLVSQNSKRNTRTYVDKCPNICTS